MATQINVDNFEQLLPKILQEIAGCTFFAIDTELTGLVGSDSCKPNLFDTVADRYQKQRRSAAELLIVQFGLTLFTKARMDNRYLVSSYSFYLCPRLYSTLNDRCVSVRLSAAEFLTNNGFDFNQWLIRGLPYLSEPEHTELMALLDADDFDHSLEEHSAEVDQLGQLIGTVKTWLTDKNRQAGSGIAAEQMMLKVRPQCNRYKRYALVRSLQAEFSKELSIRSINEDHLLVKLIHSGTEREVAELKHQEDRANVINYLQGFSRVFHAMVDSQKPLVGHNLMVDLLMIHQHLFRPLPAKLNQFKSNMHRLFPQIYDTKHIFLAAKKEFPELKPTFDVSSLGAIYESVETDEFTMHFPFMPKIGTSEFGGDQRMVTKAHDAGFDSFAAGTVFLKLAHCLTMHNKMSPKIAPSWLEYLENMEPFKNRVNLIRCEQHSLALDNNDPEFRIRPKWLFARKRNGTKLNVQDLMSKVAPFGQADVERISSSKAILAVSSYPAQRDILGFFEKDEDYEVVLYNILKHDGKTRCLLWSLLGFGIGAGAFGLWKLIKN